MRETLRHLASTGKTVFVSSHILGEVQQLADVVGIIATGRLVREGPIEQLLRRRGRRPRPGGRRRGRAATGDPRSGCRRTGPSTRTAARTGWLSVRVEPDRAAEVNRALATAGIYASRLETGSDLESLFLELTADAQERRRARARSSGSPARRVAARAPGEPPAAKRRDDGAAS